MQYIIIQLLYSRYTTDNLCLWRLQTQASTTMLINWGVRREHHLKATHGWWSNSHLCPVTSIPPATLPCHLLAVYLVPWPRVKRGENVLTHQKTILLINPASSLGLGGCFLRAWSIVVFPGSRLESTSRRACSPRQDWRDTQPSRPSAGPALRALFFSLRVSLSGNSKVHRGARFTSQ